LLEFVDFSNIAPGQIPEGACLLTTARVAQTESALTETEEVPNYEDYTCPLEGNANTPDSAQLQADGTPFRTVMTGAGISSAVAEPLPRDFQTWMISFSLVQESPEVAALLDYVGNNPNRPMGILLDGRLLSYPTIMPGLAQKARDGEMDGGVITGNFTRYGARLLAAQLQGGAVPVPITLERIEVVFVE
jgi:preprotein translocase subunit SecD